MPPAAPAPFSREVRRSVAAANLSSQPSTSRSGPRRSPSAARRSWSRRRGRSAGCRRRWRRRADAGEPRRGQGRGRPWSPMSRAIAPLSRMPSDVAPSAASTPAPPSLVPVPPSPTTILRAPDSTAARISSPTPKLSPNSGPPSTRCSPTAWALSTYADVLDAQHRRRHALAVRSLDGDRRGARRRARRGARRRSRDRRRPSAPGRARRRASAARQPSAMASAASTAVRVPANLSGAISTRMAAILSHPGARDQIRARRGRTDRTAWMTASRRAARTSSRRAWHSTQRARPPHLEHRGRYGWRWSASDGRVRVGRRLVRRDALLGRHQDPEHRVDQQLAARDHHQEQHEEQSGDPGRQAEPAPDAGADAAEDLAVPGRTRPCWAKLERMSVMVFLRLIDW